MESEESSRWVTERAECNVDSIFDQLVELVEQAITERNRSLPEDRRFIFDGGPDYTVRTRRISQMNGYPDVNASLLCTIVCNKIIPPQEGSVHVFIGDWNHQTLMEGEGFTIEPFWNQEHTQCQLTVSSREEPMRRDELEEVVREFLGPLLFPEQ